MLHPLRVLDLVVHVYSHTLGRIRIPSSAEGILVTGIQSVATDSGEGNDCTTVVGGAVDGSVGGCGGSGGLVGSGGLKSSTSSLTSGGNYQFGGGSRLVGSLSKMSLLRNGGSIRGNVVNEKIFRKLNKIDSAAKVISYVETQDEAITHYAKKRVQRMMHYPVSLRPFVATIEVPPPPMKDSFDNIDFPTVKFQQSPTKEGRGMSRRPSDLKIERSESDDTGSPFMCTPKSFPPTPSSRAHVLARGTRFAEDVVFLARDQPRVEEALDSKNDKTLGFGHRRMPLIGW